MGTVSHLSVIIGAVITVWCAPLAYGQVSLEILIGNGERRTVFTPKEQIPISIKLSAASQTPLQTSTSIKDGTVIVQNWARALTATTQQASHVIGYLQPENFRKATYTAETVIDDGTQTQTFTKTFRIAPVPDMQGTYVALGIDNAGDDESEVHTNIANWAAHNVQLYFASQKDLSRDLALWYGRSFSVRRVGKSIAGSPAEWSFCPLTDGIQTEVDTAVFASGSKSAHLTVNDQSVKSELFSNIFTVSPSTTYTLSVWIKGNNIDTQGDGVNMRLVMGATNDWTVPIGTGADYRQCVVFSPSDRGTFDWTLRTFNFTTESWQKYAKLHLQLRFTEGELWYDNVSIVESGENVLPNGDFEDVPYLYASGYDDRRLDGSNRQMTDTMDFPNQLGYASPYRRQSEAESLATMVADDALFPAFNGHVITGDDYAQWFGMDYNQFNIDDIWDIYGIDVSDENDRPSETRSDPEEPALHLAPTSIDRTHGIISDNDPWLLQQYYWSKYVWADFGKRCSTEIAEVTDGYGCIGPIPGSMLNPVMQLRSAQFPPLNFGSDGFSLTSYYYYNTLWQPQLAHQWWLDCTRMGKEAMPVWILIDSNKDVESYAMQNAWQAMSGGAEGILYNRQAIMTSTTEQVMNYFAQISHDFGLIFQQQQRTEKNVGLLVPFEQQAFNSITNFQLFYAYANLLQAKVDVEPVWPDAFTAQELASKYDVLLLTQTNWLTQSNQELLEDYIAGGGTVLIDNICDNAVTINGAIRLTHSFGGTTLGSYGNTSDIAQVRATLGNYTTPSWDCDETFTVIRPYMVEDMPLAWIINTRNYSDYIALRDDFTETKSVALGYGTNNINVNVTRPDDGRIVYDVLNQTTVNTTSQNGVMTIPLTIGKWDGKLLAFLPASPNDISVSGTTTLYQGGQGQLSLSVQSTNGTIDAPFQLNIKALEPGSVANDDLSARLLTSHGQVNYTFNIPKNAPTGSWTLQIKEPISGVTKNVSLTIQAPGATMEMATPFTLDVNQTQTILLKQQPSQLESLCKYTISGWRCPANSNASATLQVLLYWYDENSNLIEMTSSSYSSPADQTWQPFHWEVTCPDGATNYSVKVKALDDDIMVGDMTMEEDIPRERILNGGFEAIDDSWPICWDYNNGSVEIDDTVSRSGSNSLKITVDTSGGWTYGGVRTYGTPEDGYADLFSLKPNTTYRITFWVKGENVSASGEHINLRLMLSPVDDLWWTVPIGSQSGERQYLVFQAYDSGTFDWTRKTFTFTTESWQKFGMLYMQLRNTDGTVWYDDVSIQEADLVADGGFEAHTNNALHYWDIITYTATANATLDQSVSHSGNNSVRLQVNDATSLNYASVQTSSPNIFLLEPNSSYTLSFWIKGQNVSASGDHINIRLMLSPTDDQWWTVPIGSDPEQRQYLVFQAYDSGTFDWTQKTFNFSTSGWHRYGLLYLQLRNTTGTVWYDDVSLVKN